MKNVTTNSALDSKRVYYIRNFDWALKLTFRYLGKHEFAVATVDSVFVRLFRSASDSLVAAGPHDQPSSRVKEIFVKAAIRAALQEAPQDTALARERQVQSYLRQLAGLKNETADTSKYRKAIAQLLLLPLYPRLAYNSCIIEGYSDSKAAELLGITESQVADHLQQARALLCDPDHF